MNEDAPSPGITLYVQVHGYYVRFQVPLEFVGDIGNYLASVEKNLRGFSSESEVKPWTWGQSANADKPADAHFCARHKVPYKQYSNNDGDTWYAHKQGDSWCNEKWAKKE